MLADYAASQRPLEEADRVDLTHLAFVSIDSARNVDIDDALYAEVTSEGWTLYVAIADPTAYLEGCPEAEAALAREGHLSLFPRRRHPDVTRDNQPRPLRAQRRSHPAGRLCAR